MLSLVRVISGQPRQTPDVGKVLHQPLLAAFNIGMPTVSAYIEAEAVPYPSGILELGCKLHGFTLSNKCQLYFRQLNAGIGCIILRILNWL